MPTDALPRLPSILKGWNDPRFTSLIQLISDTFRIKQILKAFDNQVLDKVSENLMTSFRSLLNVLVSTISSANTLEMTTRPMIEVVQACIDIVSRLRSANIIVPQTLFHLIIDLIETLKHLRGYHFNK